MANRVLKKKSWKTMSPNERKQEMSRHWGNVARIHAKIDQPDWLAHQIYRFVYEGYSRETGALIKRLKELAPRSPRTRALELILQSEKSNPTPFGGLIPFGQMYANDLLVAKHE
jgi:hypothetical protein